MNTPLSVSLKEELRFGNCKKETPWSETITRFIGYFSQSFDVGIMLASTEE